MTTAADRVQKCFSGRPVLVVGGDGFLAQNAIRRLVGLRAQVTVLVRGANRRPHPLVRAVIVGDVREAAVVRQAIAGQDVVLNFVGVTSAVTSNRMPSVSLLEECLPHLSLLSACAEQTAPPLVVFPSSRLVYGKPRYLPVDEGHPTEPLTVYGIHKLTVEHYLRVYRESRAVPYLAFRISNPYGPHQLEQRGYGILNMFIQQALSGKPIRLFGDGAQRRDFVFVDDLVDMMFTAVATPDCHNQIFNLGGPEAIPLVNAARLIAAAAGGVPVLHEPWPAEHLKVETGDYLGNVDKISRLLPRFRFTPLQEGIAATVAAYREAYAIQTAAETEQSPGASRAPIVRTDPLATSPISPSLPAAPGSTSAGN